jgi:ribonuclease HI
VIFDEDGIEIERQGLLIGRATNNVAEWTGLMRGVQRAVEMGATELAIRGDSQLAIRQLLGEYRVKHPDLKPFHAATISALSGLKTWSAVHVLRDKNAEADALVNETLDAGRNLP